MVVDDTLRCPACHSPLEYVPDGEADVLVYSKVTRRVEPRRMKVPFVACTGCEFIYDGVSYHGIAPDLIPTP